MENHRALAAVVRVGFMAEVCLLTFAPNSAHSQQTAPRAPQVKDPFADVRERRQHEVQLRSAEMVGAAKKVDTRNLEAAAKQMREDFKGIQVLRNNVVRHLLSDKPLDYKFIASETEGIHKRANRIQAHLTRESVESKIKEEGKSIPIGDNQMKDALVTMCKRIDRFTENPVFKLPDVVDAPQSEKAGRDLQDIILLSGGIVKLAEKLNKNPGN